jgi:hypothetical protein
VIIIKLSHTLWSVPDGLSILGRSLMQVGMLALLHASISAQEMEPRAYSPAPIGAQFVVLTFAHQTGDVLLDSSLPLRDVTVGINAASMGYGRTFSLAGRQANVAVLWPYLWGTVTGTVLEDQLTVRRSGGADLRARFSMLLKGGPALELPEFAARKPRTIVGASLSIIAPTGQYDPRRLVNPGSNRWAFKPEIGISKPKGRWTIELTSGLWLFTANKNFFGGSERSQKPLASFQAHAIYTLRRRMWLSADAAYYTGGQTTVNGGVNSDRQKNSRLGATFSLPLTQRQSFKAAWAKGVTTRSGGHLNTIVLGWAYSWVK